MIMVPSRKNTPVPAKPGQDRSLRLKAYPCAEEQSEYGCDRHGDRLCQPEKYRNEQDQETIPTSLIQTFGNEIV